MRRLTRREFLAVMLGAAGVAAVGAAGILLTGSSGPTSRTSSSVVLPGKRYIRLRTLTENSVWALSTSQGAPKNWNAQQVISIISDLKPNVLQRYITGIQNPIANVPSNPSMTVEEFLQASMDASGSIIVPRISLDEYNAGTFFQTSQNLLSLNLDPPMRYLSLDNWSNFSTAHSNDTIVSLFEQLYGDGWTQIGVNESGGYYSDFGYADWADVNTDLSTMLPQSEVLAAVQGEGNIKRIFSIIDFPNTMMNFIALPPDTQATILTNLASHQAADGYTVVYNLLQGFYDSTLFSTSASGPYGGQTIYEVVKNLLNQYN
jgi:hypothetical protein